MDAHNALQQLLKSPFSMLDPGDTGIVPIDRWFGVLGMTSAAAETRKILGPAKAGYFVAVTLVTDGGTITATVYDSAGSVTGTVAFDDAADWILLMSVEISAGVFAWRAVATYGTTNTVPTATANTTATGVTYAGSTGANDIVFPTNLADGLSVVDSAAVDFIQFVSTTGSPMTNLIANVSLANASTPYLETASGKSYTGYLKVKGKTSAGVKLTCADAMGYTLTVSAAAVASADRTLTLPDPGGADSVCYIGLAQTLVGKTLTTPTLNTPVINKPTTSTHAAYTAAGTPAVMGDYDQLLVTGVDSQAAYGVKLAALTATRKVLIINTSAYACTLYPNTSGTINGLAGNAPVTLKAGYSYIVLASATDTLWCSELTPAGAYT